MMRAMFSGVMGLRAHQLKLDVIGNNVSNVNTVGYKASRAAFGDVFSQTLRGDSPSTQTTSATNAMQVGLGAVVQSVDSILGQGSLQLTGRSTDMAIQGNGFFVLSDSVKRMYGRAGNFSRDDKGYLVSASGWRIQGWMADVNGNFATRDDTTLQDIRIITGQTLLPVPTTTLRLGQSLDAEAPVGTEYSTAMGVIDTLGKEQTVILKFKKGAVNQWDWAAFAADGTTLLNIGGAADKDGSVDGKTGQTFAQGGSYAGAGGQLRFGADGSLQEAVAGQPNFGSFVLPAFNGSAQKTIYLDFSQVTQPTLPGSLESTLRVVARDGSTVGTLEDFSVDSRGVISGVFSNGNRRVLGQIAVASFPNPEGLLRIGQTAFTISNNSGLPMVGEAGTGPRGALAPSNLEMSNVDLGAEFTDMIIAQRGFQANSRSVTVADEMLQELVNLRR